MNLADRTDLRLQHEENALLAEFETWRNHSRSGTPFAKNNSQILRITGEVKAYLATNAEDAMQERDPLERQEIRLSGLLYANYVWAYFRNKFAQRRIAFFEPMLSCADEFAWQCYGPARSRAQESGTIAKDDLKEPPLTFFDSDVTPYMRGRRTLFIHDGVGKLQQQFEELQDTLAELPVPLVSLPWLQVGHLPAAVSIAHEVGHVVEHDFKLGPIYEQAIQDLHLDAERTRAWIAWSSELFADMYGCLCAGPAHVLALIDYLAGPQRVVKYKTVDTSNPGAYPPRRLRIEFNLAVLYALNIQDEGAKSLWQNTYGQPPSHEHAADYKQYNDQMTKVLEVLLATKLPVFGGKSISEVIAMTAAEWKGIKDKATRILEKQEPLIGDFKERDFFRKWFAAAAFAYYLDPAAYASERAEYRLMRILPQAITGTTRGATQFVEPEKQLVERIDKCATGKALGRHFVEIVEREDS